MTNQIHKLGHLKDEEGWYTERAANRYSEYKAWIEKYDKAHTAKNEWELKAKTLAGKIATAKMAFIKKVLNALLIHHVPNLDSLLHTEAQPETEHETTPAEAN